MLSLVLLPVLSLDLFIVDCRLSSIILLLTERREDSAGDNFLVLKETIPQTVKCYYLAVLFLRCSRSVLDRSRMFFKSFKIRYSNIPFSLTGRR